MTPQSSSFGLSHFFQQADAMALGLLALLLLMSVCTWTLAGQYIVSAYRNRKHYQALTSPRNTVVSAADFKPASIFSYAYTTYQQQTDSNNNTNTNNTDLLLDQCASRLDQGQIVLASIAATAPFAGLLGTVWGIYHALIAVAASGQASIEKIMGPVGETLLMTALGLLVALPAVLVYNLATRSNAKRLLQVQRLLPLILTAANTSANTSADTSANTSAQTHPKNA